MDKRIVKTKRALKEALFSLVEKEDFESVKITQLCETADISRNTFYNYYSDKYALLEDCFSDYEARFLKEFDRRQKEGGPGSGMEKSFLNLIDTFFELEKDYNTISILSSFDLTTMYYRTSMNILEKYEEKYSFYISPDYDLKQLNSFLVLGFWGFIHGNHKLGREAIRNRTRKLVADLLKSPIFRER